MNVATGKGDARFRTQFRKTELCSYFEKGHCSRGYICDYAHGAAELKSAPDLRKTSLCKRWLQFACGRSSSECPFAHGWHEMRATDEYTRKPKVHKGRSSTEDLGENIQCSNDTLVNTSPGGEAPQRPAAGRARPIALSDAIDAAVGLREAPAAQLPTTPCSPVVPVVIINVPTTPAAPTPAPPVCLIAAPDAAQALAQLLRSAMPEYYED